MNGDTGTHGDTGRRGEEAAMLAELERIAAISVAERAAAFAELHERLRAALDEDAAGADGTA